MPKFDLSAHAKTVITERSIELEWLERVLAKPEKIEADRSSGICRQERVPGFRARPARKLVSAEQRQPFG